MNNIYDIYNIEIYKIILGAVITAIPVLVTIITWLWSKVNKDIDKISQNVNITLTNVNKDLSEIKKDVLDIKESISQIQLKINDFEKFIYFINGMHGSLFKNNIDE